MDSPLLNLKVDNVPFEWFGCNWQFYYPLLILLRSGRALICHYILTTVILQHHLYALNLSALGMEVKSFFHHKSHSPFQISGCLCDFGGFGCVTQLVLFLRFSEWVFVILFPDFLSTLPGLHEGITPPGYKYKCDYKYKHTNISTNTNTHTQTRTQMQILVHP